MIWQKMKRTSVWKVSDTATKYKCRVHTTGFGWRFVVDLIGDDKKEVREAANAIVALGEKGKKK